MMDAKTGKEVLTTSDLNYYIWTIDRKQFIYGSQSGIAS